MPLRRRDSSQRVALIAFIQCFPTRIGDLIERVLLPLLQHSHHRVKIIVVLSGELVPVAPDLFQDFIFLVGNYLQELDRRADFWISSCSF
jgi:hypothetical protein